MTPAPNLRAVTPSPEQQLRQLFTREERDCIEWTGRRDVDGYGRLGPKLAHRIAFEQANGPIPRGMYVCHRCDNPSCVNPTHLFLGTQTDNMADMVAVVPKSTEQRLRSLFARENELLAELAQVREEQRVARNDYASERGLLMRPSLEALRKVVG
jgi:hypothetical protein